VEGEDFYNVAEAGVVALAHEAAEMYDLAPSLTEALDDACREEDVARIKEAVTNILQAVDEARGSL
jgi:hypothetical protein